MSRPIAVFRFDASTAIGGGHAMRCLALADALGQSGWHCVLAVSSETLSTVPVIVDRQKQQIIVVDHEQDGEPFRLQEVESADLLVIDHYGYSAEFERACRKWARRILVIDDLADREHDCDDLVDQTLGRRVADYAALTPAGCRLRLGPEYALLRPQFAAARTAVVDARAERRHARHVFIALGASDPANVTGRVLEAIGESGLELKVSVVLGAASLHEAELRALARRLPQDIVVHGSVTNMAALMSEADIAVGAAGHSSWERCCMGLPTILLVTADNQRDIADVLETTGAAISLGRHDEIDTAAIADAVKRLVSDAGLRQSLGTAALRICDGQGTTRVVESLMA